MEQRYLDKPWETGRRIPVNEDTPRQPKSKHTERFFAQLNKERKSSWRKARIKEAAIKTVVVGASTVFILWAFGFVLSSILAVGGPIVLICFIILILNSIFDWV